MLINILTALGILVLLFILYQNIKGNPEAFSLMNLNKSFTTLGILALLLIAIVGFAIMMLKH